MWAVLSVPLPALADPWEGPSLTEAVAKSWAALRPFSALQWRQGNAEREEGEGTWAPPSGMVGLEEDCAGGRLLSILRARHRDVCHEEGSGPPGAPSGKTR